MFLRKIYKVTFILVLIVGFLFAQLNAQVNTEQGINAKEIVEKAYNQSRSSENFIQLKMTIIRPTWQREMVMRSWSIGNDYSLVFVDKPKKNRGTATLKVRKEAWTYIPTIERSIKISSSQMSQSWMGSDFTNEDLLREASIIHDYDHSFLRKEPYEGVEAYVIESIPKENAPVVWGKIVSWYDPKRVVALKSEFYDEEGFLVNTMLLSKVKKIDNRYLPTHQEMIPNDKPDQKTVLEIENIDFSPKLNNRFFSLNNLKRIR